MAEDVTDESEPLVADEDETPPSEDDEEPVPAIVDMDIVSEIEDLEPIFDETEEPGARGWVDVA